MDINIAILPDAGLGAILANVSASLVAFGNTLVLKTDAPPFPHLTLYLTGFEDDCVNTIPKLVQGNISNIPAPALRVSSGCKISPKGTVMLQVEKTPELDHLHRWMIHKLNPFRMRARPQFWEERRARYGPEEIDKLDRLGYPHALDAWSPHFNIGTVDPARDEEVRAFLESAGFEGVAASIGIGAVGAHGAFASLIGECYFLGGLGSGR